MLLLSVVLEPLVLVLGGLAFEVLLEDLAFEVLLGDLSDDRGLMEMMGPGRVLVEVLEPGQAKVDCYYEQEG